MSKNKDPLDVEAKLAELRKSLTDDVNEMLNDNDCHRFLTARKYDIPKTLEMVNKWAHWFTHPFTDLDCQPDIKNLCPKDCLAHETDSKEALLEDVYFYSYCGDDKEGRPLYIEKLGLLASKYAFITKNLTEDEMYLRHIRMQELMASRRVANSVKYNKHIGKQIAILDLKGFPLWPDSKGFRWIKRCIEIDEAYYPETLEHLFVINAPIWFTAIWAIVKPWIDEVTVEKIQIIGAAYEPILKKYIADDQLPVDLGGTYENYPWKWPDNYKL